MRYCQFKNREDAAIQLSERLSRLNMEAPVILGIPRGGVVLAVILAQRLKGEADLLLTRKLRAPGQPELAIGAVAEDGSVFLDFPEMASKSYVDTEADHQLSEIKRRRKLFTAVCPPISLKGRTVVVVDDGIATGATIRAGLKMLRGKGAKKVIVAVPVAPTDKVNEFADLCDEFICLHASDHFMAVGQFYADFNQVSDEEVLKLLRGVQDSVGGDYRTIERNEVISDIEGNLGF